MEADGAVVLWQRSEENHALQYMKFIGDGDSKSYSNVLEIKPYGDEPENQVKKLNCVGHVQKRMGTAFRGLVTKSKSEKLADGKGLGGKSRLTKKRIDDFHTYYGKAIHSNINDVDGMQRAILAIVYHSASATEQPQHQYCPVGATSWCRYQQDATYQPKEPLPEAVFSAVLPVFERLSSLSPYFRCKDGYTQNQNESFHSTVWKRCPKEKFHGLKSVETAVADAVCHWNSGAHSAEAVMKEVGVTPGLFTTRAFDEDRSRLYAAGKSPSEEGKQARKRR